MSRSPVVLFAGKAEDRPAYAEHLPRAAAAAGQPIDLRMAPEEADPAEVDYMVFAASGPVTDFRPYVRLRAILALWAGVERILALDLPADVPLCRMVEDGLTRGMIDYVVGHAFRHHLDIDRYVHGRPGAWGAEAPPLARDRRITVLGLGALGAACAERLALNGFAVTGWARGEKSVPGVRCLAGADGFGPALDGAEILVLLLPETARTRRLLDAPAIARLAPGACVINAGRGPLIDHAALLAALDDGRLGHATLDVFDEEPLPPGDPYWHHPRVTVTPHVASVTRPETASEALVAQIARGERGAPFKHVVRRDRGY